jgi:hypothetical protein
MHVQCNTQPNRQPSSETGNSRCKRDVSVCYMCVHRDHHTAADTDSSVHKSPITLKPSEIAGSGCTYLHGHVDPRTLGNQSMEPEEAEATPRRSWYTWMYSSKPPEPNIGLSKPRKVSGTTIDITDSPAKGGTWAVCLQRNKSGMLKREVRKQAQQLCRGEPWEPGGLVGEGCMGLKQPNRWAVRPAHTWHNAVAARQGRLHARGLGYHRILLARPPYRCIKGTSRNIHVPTEKVHALSIRLKMLSVLVSSTERVC